MKFHPLVIDTPLPTCFNNPFDYEPDAICRAAAAQLQATLPPTPIEGKMYGVLVVEHQWRRLCSRSIRLSTTRRILQSPRGRNYSSQQENSTVESLNSL